MNYNVLYISYDGLLEPLGKSQVIPYLKGLSGKGIKCIVLSFEKGYSLVGNNVYSLERELSLSGILWKRLIYHKRPAVLATLFDIFCGFLYSAWLVKRYRIKIVHTRGYVVSSIALILQKLFRTKFIFDMRGLWPDEKVDAGVWKKDGFIYVTVKALEKLFFKFSDTIVVLSFAGEKLIRNMFNLDSKKKVIAIPTCTDLALFNIKPVGDKISKEMDIQGRFVMAYLGSLGSWYMPQEMLDFFNISREFFPRPLFLFLINNGSFNMMRSAISKKKISSRDYFVKSLDYQQVNEGLNIADASIFFIKPVMSKIVSCPTKFGESLACGVPVIINSGIGDTAEIVRNERVGVVIDEFSTFAYRKALDELTKLLEEKELFRQRCRFVAEKYFSLVNGVQSYLEIYRQLLKR